jgi:hypothetical protein
LSGHDRQVAQTNIERQPAMADAGHSTAYLAYPVIAGLSQSGCAFCRHVADVEGQAAWSLLYEGKSVPEMRADVRTAGGFCARHNTLILAIAHRDDLTAGLASLYESLLRADIAQLQDWRQRRRGQPHPLRRDQACVLCRSSAASQERMASFLASRFAVDAAAMPAYQQSDGFCVRHVMMTTTSAPRATADQLIADLTIRMDTIAGRLAEYQRKRDYRFQSEPRGDEQWATRDAARLYTGDLQPPDRRRSP